MTDDFLNDYWRQRHEALLDRMRAASQRKPTLAQQPSVQTAPERERVADLRREYGAIVDRYTRRYGKRANWPDAALAELDAVLNEWHEARSGLVKNTAPANEQCFRCGAPVYDGRDMCLECRRDEELR